MNNLYLLQFACFLFMLFNALVLGVTRLHMKWFNRRYERSRWLILLAMLILAMQFLMQMLLGFRAKGDAMGAVLNMLVYPPCFSLIAIGIYNIEATHANRRKMNIVCAGIYAAILSVFGIGYSQSGSFHIGNWLYAMNVLFAINVAYCIYMVVVEIRKRKKMLEVMAGGDILPYVRYARASVFILFLPALSIPFAILSTKSLYVIGPLGLLAVIFFTLNFVALGYNYEPAEELLDKEVEEEVEEEVDMDSNLLEDKPQIEDKLQESELMEDKQQMEDKPMESVEDVAADSEQHDSVQRDSVQRDAEQTLGYQFPAERLKIIREKLDAWNATGGYKDTALNMITLSRSLGITKTEFSRYLSSCLHSTFRIWLAEIRLEAAKKMMLENPDFSNDFISAECGFSSRTHLYRLFKEKDGCSPTVWRAKNC